MARPLSFQQIQAFRAVVLSGTTVAAARMLNTTQPSISRLIAQAQTSAGLKLFVNDRGRLQLTREGRHLFETVQQHFLGLEKIEKTVAALRVSGAGVFRIACTPALAQSILPPAMRRFAKRNPNVHYNVATLGSMDIQEGLRLGMYDIAITNTRFDGAEFVVSVLEEAPAVCIFAFGNPLSKLETVSVKDLSGQILIGLPEHDELTRRVRGLFDAEQLTVSSRVETPYSATVCALAAEGLGVSVMNPYMAAMFQDRLCVRPLLPSVQVVTYGSVFRYAASSELADQFLGDLRIVLKVADWAPATSSARRRENMRPRKLK